MIQRRFNPNNRYQIVKYGRMSDPKQQNRRSPDQQFAEADRLITRLGCPWTEVGCYRDDGVKGRYFRNRPGLQAMLRDIETSTIKVDLIVVDTWERFGRREEFDNLRSRLFNDHGVLIVTTDSGFADPTGVVGGALRLVENIRSTEEGRIKSHQVLRGKRDTLERKRWPGGPPPFGFRLKKLIDNSRPEPEFYSVLEHDPGTIWIRRELMFKAKETGWGGTRLAKWLNARPDIPDEFKPFNGPNTRLWIIDPINVGDYVWGELNTDIVNDTRVIERNPNADEIIRVEGFCEPIVPRDVFEAVRAMVMARSTAAIAARKKKNGPEKLIQPVARGIPLEHALSGLVVCECGGSMTPQTSGRQSKGGKTYTYRVCPRAYDGSCGNTHHVRENALMGAVIGRLRARLLPAAEGVPPEWYPEVVALVHAELDKARQAEPDRVAAKQEQIADLEARCTGWRVSLGNPSLAPGVRAMLETDMAVVQQKIEDLRCDLAQAEAREQVVKGAIDPRAVLDGLRRLSEVLSAFNPALLNIELAKHIVEIRCFRDGRVVLKGTQLGVFDGAVEMLTRMAEPEDPATTSDGDGSGTLAQVKPRRRARRYVPNLTGETQVTTNDLHRALDPRRFEGLPECFVWEETFYIEREPYWFESYADEVYDAWLKERNLSELARRYGKSVPTIRKARNLGQARAAADGGGAAGEAESMA